MPKKQKNIRRARDAKVVLTTSKIFANGKAIEPLRDITNPDQLRLLYWDGKNATIGSELKCDGQRYIPAPIDPTILPALTLPTGIAACTSPRKLLTDIAKVMTLYAGFPENSVAAMGRWVLSNWFPEIQPAPGLSVVGPDKTAGRQLFQLLHCLCRHPLLLTQVSAAGLRALPTEWNLTLLIHQSELSVQLQRMLSIARRGIGFIPSGGRLLDFHCAVATYTEFGIARDAGIIPSLEMSVVPARQDLPVLDNTMRQKIASDFQPKLLGYRLANYAKVLNSAFNAPVLMPTMQELAQGLGACTPDDPDLQAQVTEFLRFQDEETRSAAWLDLDTVIIEVILAFVHEASERSVYVGEIAEAAETILSGRGENRQLEPRAVGERLRLLGFITEPRDGKGIRLVLTRDLSRRVHALADSFSVPSVQDCLKRCEECK